MPVTPMVSGNGRILPMSDDDGSISMATGLSKREHFAGLAMQGLVSEMAKYKGISLDNLWESISRDSVNLADALLKELDNE